MILSTPDDSAPNPDIALRRLVKSMLRMHLNQALAAEGERWSILVELENAIQHEAKADFAKTDQAAYVQTRYMRILDEVVRELRNTFKEVKDDEWFERECSVFKAQFDPMDILILSKSVANA